ncbi:MAG: DUF5011 domain-containing protein [Bacteroidota bacterium]
MRKIFFISTLLLTGVVFTLTSCKKNETEENTPTPVTPTVDTTPPVITLMGDANMTIILNSTFTDPGATATDNINGDITANITVTGTVNKDLAGSYTLKYSVSDAAGNTATKNRTVSVENAATNLAGSYNVTDVIGGGTPYAYTDFIAASSYVNNRIWVSKFAYYTNAAVYFDVNPINNTIVIPSQTVVCGSPAASRVFVGSGTYISSPNTVLTINYTETTGGTSFTGVETYTKQ